MSQIAKDRWTHSGLRYGCMPRRHSATIVHQRREVLAWAKADFAGGSRDGEYRVHNDLIVYVLCNDGIHRIEKTSEGRTVSDRVVGRP